MASFEVPTDKIHKASKWTTYFLIDLRVTFIITYVYVSVANLISTTANSEASSDVESMTRFNVTSRLQHTDVVVSFIDDAVLWNCRKLSVTKIYYKALYSMLIGTFSFTLVAFFVTKLTIIFASKHGLPYLWKISVVQYAIECEDKTTKFDICKDPDTYCDIYLVRKKMNKLQISSNWLRLSRKISLLLSVTLLPIGMFLASITYDLHPLSCILEPTDDYIDYDNTTETVKLRFTENVVTFQHVMAFLIIVIGIIFILNILLFYKVNSWIIGKFKMELATKINLDSNK